MPGILDLRQAVEQLQALVELDAFLDLHFETFLGDALAALFELEGGDVLLEGIVDGHHVPVEVSALLDSLPGLWFEIRTVYLALTAVIRIKVLFERW